MQLNQNYYFEATSYFLRALARSRNLSVLSFSALSFVLDRLQLRSIDSMLQLSKKVLAISLTFVIILGLFFDLKAKTALRAKKNFSLGLIEVSGGLFLRPWTI